MNEKNSHLLLWSFIFSHFKPLKTQNNIILIFKNEAILGLKMVSLGFSSPKWEKTKNREVSELISFLCKKLKNYGDFFKFFLIIIIIMTKLF